MINFYSYIHAILEKDENEELIFWPDANMNEASGLSNKELLQYISNYRYLLKQCVSPAESVLLAIPSSIASISALLAIQSIGAIPVLPPAKPSIQTFLSVIKKQKINVVITKKRIGVLLYLYLKLAGIKQLYLSHANNYNTVWQPVLVPPDQPALITYSSGTTGSPKDIYRSHRVLSAQHLLIKKLFPADKKQRDFPLFPNIILHNLASGVASILPNISGFLVAHLNPAKIVEQLQDQQVDTLTGNVFYFKSIIDYLKKHPRFFPSVKTLCVGGSPVPEDLIPALKAYFPTAAHYIIYGSSEAEPIAIRNVQGLIENPLNGYPVGTPCEDLDLRISRTVDIQTPHGVYPAGEIEVRGRHVATLKSDGWLSTGDIGYLTSENNLYLTARIGNEHAYQGIQHFQIEHLLVLRPGIQQAAAINVDNGFRVFIQGKISSTEVKNILDASFPPEIIKNICFIDKIPVDNRHQSKILYHKLK
ncbi:AMP-binding protein [Pedobacter sp. PAMC26386]|nr:AMP-binding protein [Pedobacter sp. PAMC26386]